MIAGAPALAERVPAASARQEALEVSVGQALSLDDLVDRLVAMGYERVPQVEERGDLSVRGGILDVYPSTADLPARIELFGDEVESMRAFSPFTQRTIRPISRLAAWPAAEPRGADVADPLTDPGPGDAGWCGWRPPSTPPPCARRPSASRTRRPPEPWSSPRGRRIPWPGPRPSTSPRRPDPRSRPSTPSRRASPPAPRPRPRASWPGSAAPGCGSSWRSGGGGTWRARRARLARLRPVELEPGELPPAGEVGMTIMPLRAGLVSRAAGVAIVPEERLMRRRRPRRSAARSWAAAWRASST